LSDDQPDAAIREFKKKDRLTSVILCLNFESVNSRQESGDVGQNVRQFLTRAVRVRLRVVRLAKLSTGDIVAISIWFGGSAESRKEKYDIREYKKL